MILNGVLLSGGIAVASTSPYFVPRIMPEIIKYAKYKIRKRQKERAFTSSFYYLRKNGYVNIDNRKGQIFISLTEEGKKKAGKYQINNLRIKQPKKWDKKWKILIFDIKDKQRIKREALRGKIKELGLFQLQKSVWIYPYDFYREMNLLRSFFKLTKDEMQIIFDAKIENDGDAKTFFNLK